MSRFDAVLFDFFGTLTHAVSRGPRHAHLARWLGCDPRLFTAVLDPTLVERAAGGGGPARPTGAPGGPGGAGGAAPPPPAPPLPPPPATAPPRRPPPPRARA